ncbi:MAG: response regulator [Cyclobacteriaceae bacterium]
MEQLLTATAEPTKVNTKLYTILYVDDEESNLRIFRMAFKRHYNVLTASGGHEAIQMLRENDIQCLITDQKMPEMTGTELLEKVLPEFPDVIRMILTGFADIEAIVKAVNKCGIYKYITKPWDKGEMKLTIDKALETYELKSDKVKLIRELEMINNTLEQKVEKRTRELEEVNKNLMDSIRYAMTIQNAMLMDPEEIKENFSDFFLLFKPFDIVSGDFYWFAECSDGEDDILYLASIDCTGHGVAGALMSMIGESILNQIVYEHEIFEPKDILNNLNEGIQEILHQSEENMHHGMDAGILAINKNKGEVCFAGAKQNLIYSDENELKVVKGDRLSIGGFVNQQRDYSQTTLPFVEGETNFYLYSDGFQDQFGGPDLKKFGSTRILDALRDIQGLTMDQQNERMESVFEEWKGEEKQTDDVLFMGIKI